MLFWNDIVENNWEIYHLGLMVEDVGKTFEFYQSLGLVTSLLEFSTESPGEIPRITYEAYGEPLGSTGSSEQGDDWEGKVKFFKIGPLAIEMMQGSTGSTKEPNNEHFAAKGEGISHLGFLVDDLEAETAKLLEKGIPVVFTETQQDPESSESTVVMRYFDTREFGGLLLELRQKGAFGDYDERE